jgi:RHS repeat-associated protein
MGYSLPAEVVVRPPFARRASEGKKRTPRVSSCTRKSVARRLRLQERGARFYSANLARWINRDPIGEDGGVLVYGFCGNEPVGRIDIMGLADLDKMLELLGQVLTAQHECTCCGEVMAYLDCMQAGIAGNSKWVKNVLKKIENNAAKSKKIVQNIKTATDAFDYLQDIFDYQLVNGRNLQQMKQGLGLAAKVFGAASRTASLGAAMSEGDSLLLLLLAGKEFGPPGLNSFYGYYATGYDKAVTMINLLVYQGSNGQAIKWAGEACVLGDCDTATGCVSGPSLKDPWKCWKKVAP